MTDPHSRIPEEVRQLVEASEEILRWTERLTDRALEARPEVVERIRRDYQLRLRSSDTRLAAQRPLLVEIVSEREAVLASLRAEMAACAASLEENELRHEVGEFDEAELKARRAPLERELDELGVHIEREKEMVEMLSAVVERTAGDETASTISPEAAPPAESVTDVASALDVAPVLDIEPDAEFAIDLAPALDVEPAPVVEPAAVAELAGDPEPDDRELAGEPEFVVDGEPVVDGESESDVGVEPDMEAEPDVEAVTRAEPAAVEEAAGVPAPRAEEEEPEEVEEPDPGTEDAGPRFADELDFLESLSLGETGPFDAVSAMLDEEEKTSDGPG